jgi:hypothetical protein
MAFPLLPVQTMEFGETVIIDGGPSSEAGTRPDSCANEGVPPAMPRAA